MSAEDQQAGSFDEWHGRYRDTRDTKLSKLPWMADSYRAKEGVFTHSGSALKWRVLELAKCKSWGNGFRDYVGDENGRPLTQRDIAKILAVLFQRVCEAIEELVSDGFLRLEGRVIYVVDDPAFARQQQTEKDRRRKSKTRSAPLRISGEQEAKFRLFWHDDNPEQFQEYQQIKTEIKEKERRRKELQDAAWSQFQNT